MKLGNAFGEGKDQGDRCKRCFSLKEYPSPQNKRMNETPSKTAEVWLSLYICQKKVPGCNFLKLPQRFQGKHQENWSVDQRPNCCLLATDWLGDVRWTILWSRIHMVFEGVQHTLLVSKPNLFGNTWDDFPKTKMNELRCDINCCFVLNLLLIYVIFCGDRICIDKHIYEKGRLFSPKSSFSFPGNFGRENISSSTTGQQVTDFGFHGPIF